ncbi:MAG: penicillin-binding protein 2 [Candidatus Magasanikbacteria bacterium CG11_big_fil_rev_8_21_14_0_20_43_7]|uniref:Penicillin-binding protein 2 n=1 Tax=Candidatus Magasanikbacteria bacterium CG11_big_fil_rev_8_21_14_0_20_43_7 TaxID=1974654 RepID=A0A2H0N3E0_9BACT|nr:MAG: penicillin-binding protein 2 [Candidatus Magasanikbacteria bacterium CG11_big_fil_rev_8_21_14_0_20_43_7]
MNIDTSRFFPHTLDTKLDITIHAETEWIEGSSAGMGGMITGQHVSQPMYTKRNIFFLFLICVSFILLVGRVGYLQIVRGVSYRAIAEGNRQRIIPIPSERGLIFDTHGVQLTKNIPNFSLALIPQDFPSNEEERSVLINRLASLVHLSPEQVHNTIDTYGSYSYGSIIIVEDLPYETALSTHIAAADIPGISIHVGSKRLYTQSDVTGDTPIPLSLSHIIGYLGKLNPDELTALYPVGYLPSDTIGKSGIEKQYEQVLRGTYGTRSVEVDSLGKERKALIEEPPIGGSSVTLTLDINIQQQLEDLLQNVLQHHSFNSASAIVMNPQDGSILAMVSLPSFDNNDFSGGIDYNTYQAYVTNEQHPLFNRAISGTYPSGSIIKPAIAAGALQEGIITPHTSILSTGGIQVGPWFFPDWQAGGHGRTTVTKSIAWSVNTFYYYIGGGFNDFVGLGVDTIATYLTRFGFASLLGIDIPGEAVGFIPSRQWKEEVKGERWYVGDTYNLSIGQGDLLVTPLQIATYISSVANGGTLFKPHIVEKTTFIQTGEEHTVQPVVLREIPIKKEYMETVKQGMKECVEYGSCRRLSLLPFSTGAKTGTAQWSSTKEPHAWFTAFAPYENPELSITILIEEGIGGSETAAPVAFDFLNWWWKYKQGILDE